MPQWRNWVGYESCTPARFAEPEDVAGTAIFLASAASRLITGVTIPVDGGYSAS